MKHLALAAALLAAASGAAADPETYTIDPNHTFPLYEVGHMGYSIQRGRFDKTQGKIVLDLIAHTGSVDVTIDTTTVDSGVGKLDERLRGENFFNVARYPEMTFRSRELVFEGDNVKRANGELTLLGVTRPVTLEMTHFKCGTNLMLSRHVCGADMITRIRRSEFGMTYLTSLVTDEVTLRVNVEALGEH
ncbi:MAG TPA: YceI family protein [Usitatibacter sp.]|nr:YceI family protein [Usitatibacter sp.]